MNTLNIDSSTQNSVQAYILSTSAAAACSHTYAAKCEMVSGWTGTPANLTFLGDACGATVVKVGDNLYRWEANNISFAKTQGGYEVSLFDAACTASAKAMAG